MENQVWRSRVAENNRKPSRLQNAVEYTLCVAIGAILGAAFALAF